MVEIRRLSAAEGCQHLGALAEVLLDCVQGGASVGFMASLSKAEAESFFEKVFEGVARGDRILLAAFIDSKLVGTVQILIATYPNQAHRADIAKLLVLTQARGQGVSTRRLFLTATWSLSPLRKPGFDPNRLIWREFSLAPEFKNDDAALVRFEE